MSNKKSTKLNRSNQTQQDDAPYSAATLKEFVNYIRNLDPDKQFEMLRSRHPCPVIRFAYNYQFHKRWTD
ncbi:MAG TPA: hypothetical protein V6C97_18965 [Oculatellaceae cyanobacterium]